ncbi:MAG: response regulator [Alphaproteobacteria bacterium]|nr:response regulator [Alphaproteobacteria bacterium]
MSDQRDVFDFLSTMSHELRTPLNAIIGYSELLLEERDNYDPETMTSDLKRIHHAGRHLLSLIDEVVDLARLQSGRTSVARETVDAGRLVQRMLPTLVPMVTDRGNQLEWTIEPAIRLRTDPQKLAGILRTLVHRAARVTTEGFIHLVVEQIDDQVLFSVTDTGDAVDPEGLAKSFHPFADGQGGGFSAASRLVEVLGGRIEVDTQGQGTRFTVILPALDLPTGDEPSIPPLSTQDRVVLVVDDDPTVHDLMRRNLEALDCVVISATSGPEALRLAERHPPAVIALDVMMPEMDGWSTLARLRAHPKLAETPVVMMSMEKPDEDQGRGFTLGASEYLLKPIERPTLLATVERFISGRRRILIVDDEADARELARRVLMSAGYQVDEVSDGASALRYLETERPDLVLLDLMMPGIDGFAVVNEIRKNPELAAIPLVVFTSMTLTDVDRARLAHGTASIVEKSGSGEDVLQRVADLLNRQTSPARR